MVRGSKYAQRQAYKYGIDVKSAAISDNTTSTNPVGTLEVSTTSGSAFVVDATNKSQDLKN